MNWHYHQIIRTTSAHVFLLCLSVVSFCVSCNVGKAVVAHPENITCFGQERDALLKFKHHVQYDHCGLMSSWGNPNKPDCCTWNGVSCSNQSGHVIGLNLSGAPYQGDCLESQVLSPSLGELKRLKYLDLSLNSFDGMDIPTSIGSLVNLIHLNLSGSYFSGNIPNQLGNLTSLTSLDLSNNEWLSAKSLKWLFQLTSLRVLSLSRTDLSKAKHWFRIIASLPLLEVLKMDDCQLLPTPPPSSTFLQSANLRVISLSGNNFNGFSSFLWLFDTSYSSLGQSLEHLDMSGSNLQGPIPDAIGSLDHLTYLDLSRNLLSSTIPDAIGSLDHLTYLDLSRNLLSSDIPDAIGKLELLTYLDLSYNSLSSVIPDEIGNLESLTWLDLSGNLLSGTIPDAITNLQSLKDMDLSNNSLSGLIPSKIGLSGALRTMHSLSYLDLSNNRLEGSIPSTIGDLHSILKIDLSNNQLHGPIPSSLGGSPSLSHLDLSNNHLEGVIPSSIANLHYLEYLDLSRNNLSGNIPCKLDIKNPPYFANFSNNNLSGAIPKHLSYLGADSFQGNPSFRTDEIQGRCHKINIGLYVSIGLGFYTGFWAFCGTLTVKNSWRRAYFRFVDHILDNIYVTVAVNLAKLRRNSQV